MVFFFGVDMSDRSHVPKRLAPDLFLGDLEAVSADCSLLEALGVRRILIAIPDPTAESDDPFQSALDAAVAAASRLGAEVCLVRHAGKALESGAAPALLRESCDWIDAGLSSGCVLVSGPVCVAASPAVWMAVTYTAATATASAKQPVAKAFSLCRPLFPGCRMSSAQATEAAELAKAWRSDGHQGEGRGGDAAASWLVPPVASRSDSTTASASGAAAADAAGESNGSGDGANGNEAGEEQPVHPLPETAEEPPRVYPPRRYNTAALVTDFVGAAAAQVAAGDAGEDGGVEGNGVDSSGKGGDGSDGALGAPRRDVWYRCRKCRTPVFSAAMLETHEVGRGQAAFRSARCQPPMPPSNVLIPALLNSLGTASATRRPMPAAAPRTF